MRFLCRTQKADDFPANRREKGFSLIELIVCIGIILILLGLFMPTLGRSVATAKQTRTSAAANQIAALLALYCSDHHEYYPFSSSATTSFDASLQFPAVLVAAGYISSERDLDPEGWTRIGQPDIPISEALYCKPEMLSPGTSLPQSRRVPAGVRVSDVLYPSQKGSHVARRVSDGHVRTYWCCIDGAPKGSVAYVDGNVALRYWKEMVPNGQLYIDADGVGAPVYTTWYGYRGRDAQ